MRVPVTDPLKIPWTCIMPLDKNNIWWTLHSVFLNARLNLTGAKVVISVLNAPH